MYKISKKNYLNSVFYAENILAEILALPYQNDFEIYKEEWK